MGSSLPGAPTREKLQTQEQVVVQIDPECLRLALKEFFEPLRTNDPRTDFFATYRRESAEFDRDYARKYDEDLNTSLIFAGLFSAVSSAFIVDVQSKLESDPNDMTAAYMQILIHAVNNSLFPDASPSSATWTGPPPEIVTVQSLLYASLATSLFAAFLAMLGKQWVNRYLRNRGGSAADKSRDRQQKLDGLESWHFYLVIETFHRTVAGVAVAVTLFGVASYTFLTLAAIFYYNCPYQTPPSIIARTFIRYLTHSDSAFARSLRSFFSSFPSIKDLRLALRHLRSVVLRVLRSFCCVPPMAVPTENIPLAVVVGSPARIFEDVLVNWTDCRADARCVSWVLHSTTDADVIFSTVRFAADMIWYPEIAGALSPHILADLFFDCMLDGQAVPGQSEHASSIGMALATILSIHLSIEPDDDGLKGLCERVGIHVKWDPSSEPTFLLTTAILRFAAHTPTPLGEALSISTDLWNSIPSNLTTVHQLWLSRILLQTIWRWSRSQDPTIAANPFVTESIRKIFIAGEGQTFAILKTNCFLAMAISLGLQVDMLDLYAPNNNDALETAVNLFNQRLQVSIREGKVSKGALTTVLSTLVHLDPFQVMDTEEFGFLWINEVLSSGYLEEELYQISGEVMKLLEKRFYSEVPEGVPYARIAQIPPLIGFLSLCEKFSATGPPPYPGITALRILSTGPMPRADIGAAILPVLTPILMPTHHLQARSLALEIFCKFMFGWFSPRMENFLGQDLDKFLRAVGDPFQFNPHVPLRDGEPTSTPHYDPMMATVVLIELASSDLWRNHLRRSNFASCEETLSTEEGKRTALSRMIKVATHWWFEFLHTPAKIVAVIRCLEELQCLNTAEVVVMWAWTIGTVDPMDHDAWGSIERCTLQLCRTDGTGCPIALARHITDTSEEGMRIHYLIGHYDATPCRVGGTKTLAPALWVTRRLSPRHFTDLRVSQACQLRRLYRLFGYDPTTEAVSLERVEEVGESSGRPVTPVAFMDWGCSDYP